MRCFVAVDIDPGLKGKISALQKELPDDVKLVEPENLHFTLKFLGEIDEKTFSEVSALLEEVSSNFDPFVINIEKVGVFPNEKFIRVVWVGCEDLRNLHVAVERALGKSENESVPHLTIARASNQKTLPAFVKKYKDFKLGSMQVSCIKLKKSTLTRNGPVYEDVKVFYFDR